MSQLCAFDVLELECIQTINLVSLTIQHMKFSSNIALDFMQQLSQECYRTANYYRRYDFLQYH